MANPIVTFEMENGGIIKAELYPEIAPNTVNNFISLVSNGFYNGIIFHRVIRSFMIQGDVQTEQAWAALATASKENSTRTDSQII